MISARLHAAEGKLGRAADRAAIPVANADVELRGEAFEAVFGCAKYARRKAIRSRVEGCHRGRVVVDDFDDKQRSEELFARSAISLRSQEYSRRHVRADHAIERARNKIQVLDMLALLARPGRYAPGGWLTRPERPGASWQPSFVSALPRRPRPALRCPL